MQANKRNRNRTRLPPEVWHRIIAIRVEDREPARTEARGRVTEGHRSVVNLGEVCRELYWVSRRYVWESVVVEPPSEVEEFATRACRAVPGELDVLGSYIRDLKVTIGASRPFNPCWLYTLFIATTRLNKLDIYICSEEGPDQVVETMPYPMLLAIDTARPPLRHVILSDPSHLPTVAQLDVLVAASPTLDRVELQGCRGERQDRDLYSSTRGTASAVLFVRLDGGGDTERGLNELAVGWNVGRIEELWVNEGVDLTPWLMRYGGGLRRLTCSATQLAFYQQEDVLEKWCGQLESLTLYLGYGGMNPGKLPGTVRDIQLITAKGATREAEAERSNYVEEFLEDVMTQEGQQARRVRVDVRRRAMEDWLDGNGEGTEDEGIELIFEAKDAETDTEESEVDDTYSD
ncbi:hypothetical protein FA13DRAFT_1711723 [Coprinellus micaceus]|uniref:Uncharacterized protein n=1 Tax=Coprinellus micaceus TaxID=71717 RepID=A0A4Y7T593_COPMI|nr:hypothetical protein FA13DRAFT_1711723 [Coprinellus micaceus]